MNVRWDAAVQGNGFWADAQGDRPERSETGGALRARVEIFGALAGRLQQRSFVIDLPAGGSVSDIVQEVARRAGPQFAARALGRSGELQRCCRAFLDGAPVDDPHARIRGGQASSSIELILLTAAEGG
jgi:hypothetical protein